ncbi:MAG: hypothetical protein K2Q17_13370 [Nitrospiraceae bacterium]|jgi:hypothetical protein|nr:hypothetical protein [Nitrospiraceae bacterium]
MQFQRGDQPVSDDPACPLSVASRLACQFLLVTQWLSTPYFFYDLTSWQSHPTVQEAWRTACRWYTQYHSLLRDMFHRAPLPADHGPIDFRDYRTFAEAVYFAYADR